MTATPPLRRLASWTIVILVCLVSLALLPAIAYAANPGEAAYYKERWEEAEKKVAWVDTGLEEWNGNNAGVQPTQGSGSVEDPYLVSTANELRWCLVNQKSLKLTKDVDLGGRSGKNWVKINITSGITIDGDGHTVYNLYSSSGTAGEFGLVGAVSHSGFVIKDITLASAKVNVTVSAANMYAAAFVGKFNAGLAENCTVRDVLVNGNNGGTNGVAPAFAPDGSGGTGITIRNTKVINSHVYGAGCVSGFIEGPWGNAASLTMENCSATDGTVISTAGHSGGFTSCVNATTATYRNCFTNVDVYGYTMTGVFVGVTHAGTHVFENCYAAGKIEGVNNIGGFFGCPQSSTKETFTNCYSTSMVGMSSGGTLMGGFAGAATGTSYFVDCYAAGEVGTLKSAEDGTPLNDAGDPLTGQNITGFVGNNAGTKTNCYYDKQTTGMCDYGTTAGVKGVLTRELIAANSSESPVQFVNDVWAMSDGGYPELKVFSGSDDPMARAYSTASTSTVHLYASEDGSDYDTVRKIRYVFPLTSNANSGKSEFSISWSNYVGEDPANPLYPNVSPILEGNVPIVTLDKVGTADCVTSVAPGVGWLQVNAVDKESGQTGMRRLRLVPTTAIAMASFGASGLNNTDVVTSVPPAELSLDGMKVPDNETIYYDHRSTISFVTTTSTAINSFLLDSNPDKNVNDEKYKETIVTSGFPENATSEIGSDGVLVYDLGDTMSNDQLTAVLYRVGSDGTSVEVPWTDYLQRVFEGEEPAKPEDCGTYQIAYEWKNKAGDVLKAQGSKNIAIGEPAYVVYHWNDGIHTSTVESDELYEVYGVDPGLYLVGTSVGDKYKDVPVREGYDDSYWALSPVGDGGVVTLSDAVASVFSTVSALADEAGTFTAQSPLKPGRNDVYAVWVANRHELTICDEEGNPIATIPDAAFDDKLTDLIESTDALDKLTDPDGVIGWTTNRDSGIADVTDATTMPDEDVTVYPVRSASPSVSKTAQNLTHPTGENNVGDEIVYRVTAKNSGADSCWQGVVIGDKLPAGLDFVPGSAKLTLADGTLKSLDDSVYNADEHRLSCEAGDLRHGQTAVLEFRAKINVLAVDAGDSEEAAANRDLGNVGTAEGKNSNGDELSPSASEPVVPNPDPSRPGDGGPGTWTVTPFDPEPSLDKTVTNLTDPEGPVQVGDVLEHKVTVGNKAPGSVWADATVTDKVPEGLTVTPGSIKVVLSDGTVVPVPDSAYDEKTGTITYGPRSVGGEDSFDLVYETTVNGKAVDDPSIGSKPTAEGKDPHGGPADAEAEDEAIPEGLARDPKVYWADGESVTTKTAENLTRPGEPTRVEDRIRYVVKAENVRPDSLLTEVVLFDKLPEGLTPDTDTFALVAADGSKKTVKKDAWDEKSRTIAVYAGDLSYGQSAELTFEAVVDKDAAGADIGNVGASKGGLPTPGGEWVEGGPYQAGDAYHPRGGGEGIPEGAVVTDPVYPHPDDEANGVLTAEGGQALAKAVEASDGKKLAKTGDEVNGRAAVAFAAIAGFVAVVAFARRRALTRS